MASATNDTIAFITTGGTIGAAFWADMVTLSDNTGAKNVRQYVDKFIEKNELDVKMFSPLNKFSEDLTPSDWALLFKQIDKCIEEGMTRIVIAHGTDTLVYSSFATSLYYSNKPVRICFTAAFMPPSDPASDAFINLECAFQTVRGDALPTGVYFAFRGTFFEVDIFRAQDLKAIGSDQTLFGSVYGRRAARYAYDSIAGISSAGIIAERTTIIAPCVTADDPAPTEAQLSNPGAAIIQITCSPGMDIRNINYGKERETLVIFENYHSGTIPAIALRPQLEDVKKRFPKTHFVSAPHPYRYIKFPYETTSALEKMGLLKIYKDLLPHQLYVLALCETSKGKSIGDTLELVEPWRFSAPR